MANSMDLRPPVPRRLAKRHRSHRHRRPCENGNQLQAVIAGLTIDSRPRSRLPNPVQSCCKHTATTLETRTHHPEPDVAGDIRVGLVNTQETGRTSRPTSKPAIRSASRRGHRTSRRSTKESHVVHEHHPRVRKRKTDGPSLLKAWFQRSNSPWPVAPIHTDPRSVNVRGKGSGNAIESPRIATSGG